MLILVVIILPRYSLSLDVSSFEIYHLVASGVSVHPIVGYRRPYTYGCRELAVHVGRKGQGSLSLTHSYVPEPHGPEAVAIQGITSIDDQRDPHRAN